MEARKSPLFERFRSAGAKFESQAGWLVPDVVEGHEREYSAIRTGVGISDLSDMGKLRVKGQGALALLDTVFAGNVDRIVENSIRWTALLDERGRVLADVQIYNDFDNYFVTCAGPQRATVLEVLRRHAGGNVEVEDVTEKLAAVCIEGPRAMKVPPAMAGMDASGLGLLKYTRCSIQGNEVMLSRIGYTGEFGYVFFVTPEVVDPLVEHIRQVAPEAALCGRAVQDVLRLEVRGFHFERFLLRGESALEAGLHWMIDFRKSAFQGREAVLAEKQRGLARRLVAFLLEGEGTPDRGTAVHDEGQQVGYVACAARSPTLGRTVGLAYLDEPYAWVGIELGLAAGQGRLRTVSAPFLVTESTKVAAG